MILPILLTTLTFSVDSPDQNCTSYHIYEFINNGPVVIVESVQLPHVIQDANLEDGSYHFYGVRCLNDKGESDLGYGKKWMKLKAPEGVRIE